MRKEVELTDNSINKFDNTTFEKLFNELYTVLCRCAIQYVRIPEIAEEIVQEQFIDLWEKREIIKIQY